MSTPPPPTAFESAELAYQELTSLWEHLPAEWTDGQLAVLHGQSRSAVIGLFVRERGLAELVHRFFENGLARCTSTNDFAQMPLPTNLSSLFNHLHAEYAIVLSDHDTARSELKKALGASIDSLVKAAEPQVNALTLLVRRVCAVLGRLSLKKETRIILPELPVGNSIACKILSRALTRAGHNVEDLRISLPRNEAQKNGVRRIDALATRIKEFGLRENDLVIYVDEWETGSNFAAICDAFARCLSSYPSAFFLPVGLLRDNSKDEPRYHRFVKQHDARVGPFSASGSDLRIVVPPIKTKFRHRSYFFWSEHDRTSGYRKMQFLGSLYSSFDAAIEELHNDDARLTDALNKFLAHAKRSGDKVPNDMTGAHEIWRGWFTEGYDDWVTCRDSIATIEHRSNLTNVDDVDAALREVLAEIVNIVKGRPAEKALKVAAFYEREVMRISIDPENRYHFRNHAAVVTDLEGDLRLFHEMLMNKLFAHVDANVTV